MTTSGVVRFSTRGPSDTWLLWVSSRSGSIAGVIPGVAAGSLVGEGTDGDGGAAVAVGGCVWVGEGSLVGEGADEGEGAVVAAGGCVWIGEGLVMGVVTWAGSEVAVAVLGIANCVSPPPHETTIDNRTDETIIAI